MAPLMLDLKSPTVDVALEWMKDGVLPGFDLVGRVDEGVHAWSQDLMKKGVLTRFDFGNHGMELDLSDHDASGERCSKLATALVSDLCLTGLRLSRSRVGNADVDGLTKALLKANTLEVLVLSNNSLTDEACVGLAEVLKTSSKLRTLDLSGNRLTAVGAATLSDALKSNDFLTDLDLSANRITDEGAECLAAAVEANPHVLALLDLSGNRLSPGGAEMLVAAFKDSRAPGRLQLSGGPGRSWWPIEGDRSQPFYVRCLPNDVSVLPGQRSRWPVANSPEEAKTEGKPGAANEEQPIVAETSFEQDEDELDVSFKADEIHEQDRGSMSVDITEVRLTVRVKGYVLLDAELHNRVVPSESSWTVRDGTLEVYLVKAQEGVEWPKLIRT